MGYQAATLKFLSNEINMNGESPEEFLETIPRPVDLTATALIIPDIYTQSFPDIANWISFFLNSENDCLWDQSGLIDETFLPKTHTTLKYQTPKKIKSSLENLTVLPKQNNLKEILCGSQHERIKFLRQLTHNLKIFNELWISIKSSEIENYGSLIHAANKICLMVPEEEAAIVKCYEIIKKLRNSGYFSPISLLEFTSSTSYSEHNHTEKIKKVAKEFLGLDLIGLGVVLSIHTNGTMQNIFRSNKKSSENLKKNANFLHVLSENVVYNILGIT